MRSLSKDLFEVFIICSAILVIEIAAVVCIVGGYIFIARVVWP